MAVLCRSKLLKVVIDNNVVLGPALAVQKRGMYGKELRESLNIPPRKKPFPYAEKDYNAFTRFFDVTSERFDANTKLIVVEGSIAAGKTDLASQIAKEFDLKHIPAANMDTIYVNDYGYDLRQLDPQMPESCKSYDHTNFCRDPSHPTSSSFQILMFTLRYAQYVDAITHMLNTGQGVVLERSPYSDFVFIEAMYKCNFISHAARSVYYDIKQNTMFQLLHPHLVIYLDTPVNVVQQRVKERNLAHEQNSKVMSDEFLTHLERIYKTKFLKEISNSAELLVYDWTGKGDSEVVFEDIERIDFEQYEGDYTGKLKDWFFPSELDLGDTRANFTNSKWKIMSYFNVPRFDVPEMIISADDVIKRDELVLQSPGGLYRPGFNADCGDTGLLFKTKTKYKGATFMN